jgi:hypothetical protein
MKKWFPFKRLTSTSKTPQSTETAETVPRNDIDLVEHQPVEHMVDLLIASQSFHYSSSETSLLLSVLL